MRVSLFFTYYLLIIITFYTNLNSISCNDNYSALENFSEICLQNIQSSYDDEYLMSEKSNSITTKFPYLQISTVNEFFYLKTQNDSSMSMNIYDQYENNINEIILDQCEIKEKWNSKETANFYKSHVTNFEDENIPQRSFRISYLNILKVENSIDSQLDVSLYNEINEIKKKNKIYSYDYTNKSDSYNDNRKNSITINKIELISDNLKDISDKTKDNPLISKSLPRLILSQSEQQLFDNNMATSVVLEEGDSIDFFVYYNCDKYNYIKDWFDLKIRIQIDSVYYLEFHYVKICSTNFKQSTNTSYLLLILLFILVNYLCEIDFLIFNVNITKIQVEDIVHIRYAEIIIIVTLIIISILVLLAILSLFTLVVYTAGFWLSLISIKLLLNSLIANIFPNFDRYLSSLIWPFSFLKIEVNISLSNVIYYITTCFILSLWLFNFNDVFLGNFIAFAVSYVLIKKISFNNFYIVIGLYLLVIVYDIFYVFTHNIYYGDYFTMSTMLFINIPYKFIIPEINPTPFNTKYFFSIMDVIMIGFILEYLKKFNFTGKNLLIKKYAHYSMYTGLFINFVFFYIFHFYFPLFFFPGITMILTIISYTVYKKEFQVFVSLEMHEETINSKNLKDIADKITDKRLSFQMKIFTTDQSEDFKALTPCIKKYVPPPFSIKEEIDDGKEESPSDKTFKLT